MSSDKNRTIESYVDHFLNGTANDMVRKQVIDALASYGTKDIDPIKRSISDLLYKTMKDWGCIDLRRLNWLKNLLNLCL